MLLSSLAFWPLFVPSGCRHLTEFSELIFLCGHWWVIEHSEGVTGPKNEINPSEVLLYLHWQQKLLAETFGSVLKNSRLGPCFPVEWSVCRLCRNLKEDLKGCFQSDLTGWHVLTSWRNTSHNIEKCQESLAIWFLFTGKIVALAAECLGALWVTCSASPSSGSGLRECVFQDSASWCFIMPDSI